jgi:hypothetical protein
MDSVDVIVAAAINRELTISAAQAGKEWQGATPVTFCADWEGKNANPERQTTVPVLRSPETLHLRYECRYRSYTSFPIPIQAVEEIICGPAMSQKHSCNLIHRSRATTRNSKYRPNGFWIDLDISPEPLRHLNSGLQHSTWLNEGSHAWRAELAIPMQALVDHFDPKAEWHANFSRIEGAGGSRDFILRGGQQM